MTKLNSPPITPIAPSNRLSSVPGHPPRQAENHHPRGGRLAPSLSWVIILFYLGFTVTGIINFIIWDQVYIYIQDHPWYFLTQTVSSELLLNNPHVLRSMVPLPMLLLSERLNVTQETMFSLNCGICIVISSMCVNWSYRYYKNVKRGTYESLVVLGFVVISLWMNGRMCFGLAGSGILLVAHVGYITNRFSRLRTNCCNLVGLYLLLVSTGALYIGSMMFLTWLFYSTFVWQHENRSWRDSRLLHAICVVGILTLSYHAVMVFWRKLENWDEGEHIRIVQHGAAGRVWDLLSNPLVLVVALALTIGFHSYRARKIKGDPVMTYLLTCLPMGIFMGLFGNSTLATNLPLMVLVAKLAMSRSYRRTVPAIEGRLTR